MNDQEKADNALTWKVIAIAVIVFIVVIGAARCSTPTYDDRPCTVGVAGCTP